MTKHITFTSDELNALICELNAARLALDRYASHDIDCSVFGRKKVKTCDCGLDDAKINISNAEQALIEKRGNARKG